MKPVAKEDRRVVNIADAEFKPWVSETDDGADTGQSVVQLNRSKPDGVGFHLFKMAPGTTTEAHRHTADEEWFVLEGDLVDNDGTRYVPGDLVWMKAGTEHYSYSEQGCTLVVYIESSETAVT